MSEKCDLCSRIKPLKTIKVLEAEKNVCQNSAGCQEYMVKMAEAGKLERVIEEKYRPVKKNNDRFKLGDRVKFFDYRARYGIGTIVEVEREDECDVFVVHFDADGSRNKTDGYGYMTYA
jgi:hypothetical protein